MKQILPPPPTANRNINRPRRRPDLTLPLPQREPQIAVLLPLPPSSAPPLTTTTSNLRQQPFNLSEIDQINRIGSGSGGTVYKVIHRPTGRIFALKVRYGNHEDDVRRQICREIEILRDVDNLNIVKCHNMFDRAGEIQVLLEYMDEPPPSFTNHHRRSILRRTHPDTIIRHQLAGSGLETTAAADPTCRIRYNCHIHASTCEITPVPVRIGMIRPHIIPSVKLSC